MVLQAQRAARSRQQIQRQASLPPQQQQQQPLQPQPQQSSVNGARGSQLRKFNRSHGPPAPAHQVTCCHANCSPPSMKPHLHPCSFQMSGSEMSPACGKVPTKQSKGPQRSGAAGQPAALYDPRGWGDKAATHTGSGQQVGIAKHVCHIFCERAKTALHVSTVCFLRAKTDCAQCPALRQKEFLASSAPTGGLASMPVAPVVPSLGHPRATADISVGGQEMAATSDSLEADINRLSHRPAAGIVSLALLPATPLFVAVESTAKASCKVLVMKPVRPFDHSSRREFRPGCYPVGVVGIQAIDQGGRARPLPDRPQNRGHELARCVFFDARLPILPPPHAAASNCSRSTRTG